MKAYADKSQQNSSKTVANSDAQKQGGGESVFQFVDHRPEALAQSKLQEMADNSPQVRQSKKKGSSVLNKEVA